MLLLLREAKEFTEGPQETCNCREEQKKKEKVALFYAEGQRPGERRKNNWRRSISQATRNVDTLYLILQHAFLRTAANMAAAYLQRF